MKKIRNLLLIFIFLLIGGLFSSPVFFVKAEQDFQANIANGVIRKNLPEKQQSSKFSGEVINNIFYVNFKSSSNTWTNNVPNGYTKNIHTLMDNACNNSLSSVNAYYDAMSFNLLNLKTNFYYKNNSTKQTFEIPFTKNEMLYYTADRPEGYYEYAVFSLGSSGVTYEFSCYDCANAYHGENFRRHDYTYSDGVGCTCAYYNYFQPSHPLSMIQEGVESTAREWIALKTVLQQATNVSGTIDKNNDGDIDAVGFIFPETDDVTWSDLLWAHAWSCYSFDSFISQFAPGFSISIDIVAPAVRCIRSGNYLTAGFGSGQTAMLTSDIKINSKTFYDYNVYTISDLLNSGLTDVNGMEQAESYTMAHELGHTLGLPDLYVYTEEDNYSDYINSSNEAMQGLDLMSDAYRTYPSYMSTYHRQVLGFTESSNVVKLTNEGTYSLKPTNLDEKKNNNNNSKNVLAFYLEDPNYQGQKFYIEYRDVSNNFVDGLNGNPKGLIIYRVDENVLQLTGYNGDNNQGNYFGYPYNICLLKNSNGYIFNNTNNNFGNSDVASSTNAINFQTYDSSKNQKELKKNDVSFINSGIVIKNISINQQTNEISFNISGGYLESAVALDTTPPSIVLNGKTEVEVAHISLYNENDYGINEFLTSDNVDAFKDLIIDISAPILDNSTGKYKVTYTVTDTSGNTATAYRYISIIPTNFSSVVLKGNSLLEWDVYVEYVDPGIIFGTFNAGDFSYTVTQNVNVNAFGEYDYIYNLTYTKTGETFTLSRKVKIVDKIAPTIALNQDTIEMLPSEYENYEDEGVTVSDNYYPLDKIKITKIVEEFDGGVFIKYTATDNDGLGITSEEIVRTINFKYNALNESQIEISFSSEKNKLYKDELIIIQTNITYLVDNNPNSVVKICLNSIDNEIMYDANNMETSFDADGNKNISISIDYTFLEDGIYNIIVIVDSVEKNEQIIVKDINMVNGNNKTASFTLFAIIVFVIVVIFALILVKMKAKKIQDRLDRY